MPFRWFRREASPDVLDDATWHTAMQCLPVLAHLDADARRRLNDLARDFLRRKAMSGARGFEVTDAVRASVALQACLPVLELGLRAYDDFVEIVVYPSLFRVSRRQTDPAGVVHESDDWLAGEAIDGGPVVLSWADVDPHGESADLANVVIHEFVHKIDLLDGEADGLPPLPAAQRHGWERDLLAAYDDFCERLEAVERAIPRHIDPESEAADPWYATLPMDPYAATDPAEFFAVSGEVFFLDPAALQHHYPAWFSRLKSFFRQDPLSGRDAVVQQV